MIAKRELRERARELRRSGMPVREIAKELEVAKSSISTWVRDIELTPEQVERNMQNQHLYGAQNKGSRANRKKHLANRLNYQEQGRIAARAGRPLHMAGCMLYWAEGAKSRGNFYFVNSDPHMLHFFMRFLREELGLRNEDLTVRIQCHYSDRENQERIEQYWSEILNVPLTRIRKTLYKKGSELRKNTLVNGVCGIRVTRTSIAQHVYGAIQEYAGFDNPDWLF